MDAKCDPGGVPDRLFTKWAVGNAVIAELLDYFSDARVTGIRVRESEAETIAVGVLARLDSLDDYALGQSGTARRTPSLAESEPKR